MPVLFQIANIMSDTASAQINAQKRRLIVARAIDESEKRMYVQVGSRMLFFFVITHASHNCRPQSLTFGYC